MQFSLKKGIFIMKKILKIFLILSLLFFYILINCYSYANSTFEDLSENIFRLHIIANSNSKEDQELKIKIRDEIINYLKPKLQNCNNKSEIIEQISNNISEIQKIAVKTINSNGYNYNVNLEIGNFNFPTKYYGNVSMPSRKL